MARSGLICVAVSAKDAAAIIAAVMPVVHLVDVVEIRLDHMQHPVIKPCIATIPRPVLVTNRPPWEGGLFTGGEEERIALLCESIRAGARYVDIELRTEEALRMQVQQEARNHGARVIVSSHDFQTTSTVAELRKTLQQMIASGADIGKIVTTATTPEEALRILALQQEAMASHFSLCAFAMGEAGMISRLATLYLGGFMTYAAITAQQATAPGQLSVHDLHTLISLLDNHP